jgi:ectoine hydroxylase-related dioxygenase (phytanoyl-CoA dioxygenase family)
MVGVWIAFEDVNESNGTLKIVPGSHKWPVYEYHNLNLPHPDTIEDGEAKNYKIYEDFLIELIKRKKIEILLTTLMICKVYLYMY